MKPFLKLMIFIIAFASFTVHAEKKKIIKWVDKNGVTQYGDRPPLPNKASKSSVLNKQGVTVEKRDTSLSKNGKQDKALKERSRYDNALLASYNSIEEIDIARERNTRTDRQALEALEAKHSKLSAALAEDNKTLLDYAKKGKTAPSETLTSIEKKTIAIEKLDKQIAERKETLAKINQRYDNDKIRYAELESKKGSLTDLKYKNKNIIELEKWRNAAQARITSLEAEALRYKRAGSAVPARISNGLLNATRERDRAQAEIDEAKLDIKRSKEEVSR